jgi:hypothetical protein
MVGVPYAYAEVAGCLWRPSGADHESSGATFEKHCSWETFQKWYMIYYNLKILLTTTIMIYDYIYINICVNIYIYDYIYISVYICLQYVYINVRIA